jgi:hypothetical protein
MTLILNGTDNSATTPAVTGTDTDTGIYYPTSNQVAVATNGTQAMLVNAVQGVQVANTLGVGATTPSTSGAGITFPATQSASSDANTLDDYEEGTWTPTVNSSGGSITSYTSDGTYTKIGRSVLITARIGLTNVGTANGNLNITNFPFTSAGTSMQMPMIVREGNVTGQIYQIFLNNAAVLGTMQTLSGGGISWTNGYSYGAMGVYPAAS